jgi:ankyrin repeat protein
VPDQREQNLQLLTAILEPDSIEPTDDPVAQLCWAAGHGRVDRIESLLKSGVDPNAALVLDLPAFDFYDDEKERTKAEYLAAGAGIDSDEKGTITLRAMCLAVRENHVGAVRALLDGGADPNLDAGTGGPIADAVSGGFADIVKLLIERGASTMATVASTPLIHIAAGTHYPQVTRVLLDAGMDPNLLDNAGNGPLLAAARRGDLESARMLIEAGALVDPPATKPEDICDPALRLFHERSSLLRSTPLIAASETGHVEVVRLLLQHKPDITRKDSSGFTAYDHARKRNATDIIQLLRDAGAATPDTIRAVDLLAAAASGDLKGIAVAVDNGVDINTIGGVADRNRRAGTHPVEAAFKANPKGAKDLLLSMIKGTADPNLGKAMDDDRNEMVRIPREFVGMSALMLAAKNGHADAVSELIRRGANVKAGSTESMYNGQPALYFATKSGHIEVMRRLLAAGADVNACGRSIRDEPTQTALHVAADKGDVEAVKLLLGQGANPRAEAFNQTPLFWAERNGHGEAVKLLKQAAQK